MGRNSGFIPLPLLMTGTCDEDGTPDAMNAAWGGLYDAPIIDEFVMTLECFLFQEL